MSAYEQIRALAEPYWQTRSNAIHVPESYRLAEELLAAHPEADPAVVLPAILLHDIGYAMVPEEEHLDGLAGAPRSDPAITRRHEVAGARLAGELLGRVGYDPELTRRICEIIDGHDSRPAALDLEDAIVKDADKLWRFTESGVRICHGWIGRTPAEFVAFLATRVDRWLFTAPARAIASQLLSETAQRAMEDVR